MPGGWDSSMSGFIVKFTAEPAIVDKFMRSFPSFRIGPYELEYDGRKCFGAPQYIPECFTEPIQQGKMRRVPGKEDVDIYIDTTDERSFVVYMQGFY